MTDLSDKQLEIFRMARQAMDSDLEDSLELKLDGAKFIIDALLPEVKRFQERAVEVPEAGKAYLVYGEFEFGETQRTTRRMWGWAMWSEKQYWVDQRSYTVGMVTKIMELPPKETGDNDQP